MRAARAANGRSRAEADLARAAVRAEGSTIGVNNGDATGQTIPHVHVHIVPRWPDDGAGSIHTIFPRTVKRSLPDVGSAIRRAAG